MITGALFWITVTVLVYIGACVAIGFLGWWYNRKR